MQKSKNTNPDSTRNNDYFEENINSHVTSSTTLLIDFEKELNLKAATLRSQTESLNSLNTQKQILLKQQERHCRGFRPSAAGRRIFRRGHQSRSGHYRDTGDGNFNKIQIKDLETT